MPTILSAIPAKRLALAAFLLLTASVVVGGCSTGEPVGTICSTDEDCAFGLQCFKPADELQPVCTIGCAADACETGVCITSVFGEVCATTCEFSGQCPGDLTCQVAGTGESVCWYPDENLAPLPTGLFLSSAKLISDANNDGDLSPGETAVVQFFATNASAATAQGVWAELIEADSVATITTCEQPGFPAWLACSATCSCEHLDPSTRLSIESITTSATPVLQISFFLAPETSPGDLSFKIRLHDDSGETWDSVVSVPVVARQAAIVVYEATIVHEENGDGILSPGEEAVVQVMVANYGMTKVHGLYAALGTTDQSVEVLSCAAPVGDAVVPCDLKCSCAGTSEASKQTLEPAEVGTSALLEVRFRVHADAAAGALHFAVNFHDALGTSWASAFTVEVAPDEAKLVLAHTEILEDANSDGFLSPGESASVQLFARNAGSSKAVGVWSELVVSDPLVTVETCSVGVGSGWSPCGSECSCEDATSAAKQHLEPGETATVALLVVKFEVHASAALVPLNFEVAFHDAFGNSWVDAFQVEVVAVQANIQVESVELWGDTNGDGLLTPGESANVAVRVKNSGIVKTLGLYAELTQADSLVDIAACYAETGAAWEKCDSACGCQDVGDLAKQSLEAGAIGEESILRVNFQLDATAPAEPIAFDLTFHDHFGNTWDDTFILDVELYAAELGVGFTELVDDTNGDSHLSPGESATVIIYPKNVGTVKAPGVWAQLISVEPGVTVSNCYAGDANEDGDAWVQCSASCACEGLFDAALQDLEPESTSELPMLKMDITLDPDVALGPLTFEIGFVDSLGLIWTDVVVLDVVEPDSAVGIGLYEIQSDTSGDGVLSPGESMTVDVTGENFGAATALGVWARLLSPDPNVLLTGCYAKSDDNTVSCAGTPDGGCSCMDIPTAMKMDIPGGSITPGTMLGVEFDLSPTTPVGLPIPFLIQFVDSLGNVYDDAFSLDVVVLDEGDPGP